MIVEVQCAKSFINIELNLLTVVQPSEQLFEILQ